MIRDFGNNLQQDALPAEGSTFGGRMTRNSRYQQGTLIKRGKRRPVWVGRWWEEAIGPGNERKRIRRSEILGAVADVPTRREAKKLFAERMRPINGGDYRPQATQTLRSYIQNRWMPLVRPTLKYSTNQFYSHIIQHHLIPVIGDMQLRNISRDVVQSYLSEKLRSGLSWRSVKHIRTTLGTVLKAAEDDDLISSNPVPKTRFPRRGPVAERAQINPSILKTLLEELPEPSRSIALLLASTGLRIGELLALRWRDVDLEAQRLQVRQSVYEGVFDDPKTRSSKRTVPIGKRGIEVLTRLRPSPFDSDALVFSTKRGTPLSRRNLLNRQFKPTCERLGFVGITWHWLRHVTATLSSSSGVPLGAVQTLLGHSSSEITREVYLQPVSSDVVNAVQRVEDLITGPKWTHVQEIPEPTDNVIS